MKHIMLESRNTDTIVFDVADLAARLDRLHDSRDRRGKIYPLGMIVTLVILAKPAGEDKPSGIAEWIRLRCDAFIKLFNSSADQLLAWTQRYRGIENGLHYRRDVTLREDATPISQPALAKVIAAINNFLVGLVQKLGYPNLASARRIFDARIAAQLPR